MIIKRSDIYKILRATLKGDYSIGLHGVTGYGPSWAAGEFDRETAVANATEEILKNGLKVYSYRTIHGTVAFFGRMDDADNQEHIMDGLQNYNYGGMEIVVLGIPTTMRTDSGESMFLGDSTINGEYKPFQKTQGYQTSTLRDVAMEGTVIPNNFILGAYKLLPDGRVDFELNKEHMAFKGNVISSEAIEKMKYEVTAYLIRTMYWQLRDIADTSDVLNFQNKNPEELTSIYEKYRTLLFSSQIPDEGKEAIAAYLETIKQYLHEPQMRKIEEQEDVDIDELMQELHEESDKKEVRPDLIYHEGDDVLDCIKKLDSLEIGYSEKLDIPMCRFEGGVEYLETLCSSTDFLTRAFETLQGFELNHFLIHYGRYMNTEVAKNIITSADVKKILNSCPTLLSWYPFCDIIDSEAIRKCVSEGGVIPMILHYIPEDLQGDYDFIISLIRNAPNERFDFFMPGIYEEESDLLYNSAIKKEILVKPEFWEEINKKYRSIHEGEADYIPPFDAEKEVSIYTKLLEEERAEKSELARKEGALLAAYREGKDLDKTLEALESGNQDITE